MEHRIGLLRWLMRLSLAAVGLIVVAVVLAVLNNNVSFSRPSRANFVNSLDRSLSASTAWTANQFSSDASGELIGTADQGGQLPRHCHLTRMAVRTRRVPRD